MNLYNVKKLKQEYAYYNYSNLWLSPFFQYHLNRLSVEMRSAF